MDLSTLKELFRAHMQTVAGCPVRWGTKADFAPPDGEVSPSAIAYLRITSSEILGKATEERWEGDKIRLYEHALKKNQVTVMFESADSRDNYDAFFYASKAENVLDRAEVYATTHPQRFDVQANGVRSGPTLVDDGETISTAVLEVVWTFEQITSSEVANRVTGPGLTDLQPIETLDEVGKLEDIAPDGATIALTGSCSVSG
jgi:hypothetical protein